jgi:methyl-accepting chemotaxis protein
MVLASVYFNPKLNWLALVLGVLASTAAKILAYFLNTVQDRNYYGVKSLFVKNCFPHVLMLGSIGFIFVSLGKRTDNMVSSLMGAEAQEKMLLHMKKLSEKSTEVSKGLVNEVETLTDATKSTIRVNNEISENTDTVIVGINNSMDQLEEAEGNTTQIYENIRVLAKESEEVADMFTNIEKLSNQNRTYMQQVTAGMEQATDSIGICQEAMRQLEDKTKKIDGIVDVIAEISEQTDLLSLNAAIESARAGEQGKGFAIVAEEIRKLAQQTQRTLENVREIIAEVLQQNIIAVDAMTQTSAVHAEQKEVILKTEDSSQKVMDATKNMAARMQLILNNTKNIESSASIIVDIVDSITGICKDNQNSLDEVSKSVKTGISTTNQLEQLVDAIKAMAEELAVVVQG